MRRRVHEILGNPRADDAVGRGVSFALLAVIAANVVANVLETDAGLARRAPRLFGWFEIASVAIFTIEYVLRLWSCTADLQDASAWKVRLRYAMRPMSLIDLAAIAPFYVELFLPTALDLRFLRVLRLMRLFRLLRFGRLGAAVGMLTRVVQAKRADLGATLAVVGIAVVVAAGALYTVEHGEPGTEFTSIPHAMWWSVVTITTVGYGDMAPETSIGRVLGGLVAFIGICSIALPVGILSTGVIDELGRMRAESAERCPSCGGPVDRAEVRPSDRRAGP